jgi:hypothetical protein
MRREEGSHKGTVSGGWRPAHYQRECRPLTRRASKRTSGCGVSRHVVPLEQLGRRDSWGGPADRAGRALSRGKSCRSTEPASGLGPSGLRSLRRENGGESCLLVTHYQDWSLLSSACCKVAAASTYIRSSAERLGPKSCMLEAARLQDGWDSSLVRLIRPTRHTQSHIRPGFGLQAQTKLY